MNGDYKDSVAATRNRFKRLYRDWFPPEPNGPNREEYVRVMLETWTVPHIKWCADSVSQDHPQDFFEWRVAVLRDKLRFIWVADPQAARHRLSRLVVDTLDFWLHGDRVEPWKERQLEAFDWLTRWVTARKGSRLCVCKNPDCTETKYFIRDARTPNQKYCSSPCSARAEELRRLARGKERQPRKLSPTALSAIREGQRKRRRRERMEAKKSEPLGKRPPAKAV